MGRWIVAAVLGIVVLGAVFFLYRQEQQRAADEAATHAAAQPSGDQGGSGTPASGAPASGAPASAPAANSAAPLPGGDGMAGMGSETTPAAPPKAVAPDKNAAGLINADFGWVRETIGGKDMTAAYLILTNATEQPDRLIAARSDAAQSVEIHETTAQGGVMAMRPVASIDLDPGVPVIFEPGGLHFMVLGLKSPLKRGDKLPLVLDFEKAGHLSLTLSVGEPEEGGDGPTP